MCGQSGADYNASTKNLVGEFLDNYFTLDSRLGRTVLPFVCRPGFLTREYHRGRRVHYVRPLRLYFFFSLVFFFAVGQMAPERPIGQPTPRDGGEAERPVPAADGFAEVERSVMEYGRSLIQVLPATIRPMAPQLEQKPQRAGPDSLAPARPQPRTRGIGDKLRSLRLQFRSALLGNASKVMFAVLPLFALLIKGVYAGKGWHYIHHLIFSLHFHSFAFFLLSLVAVALYSGFTWLGYLADVLLLALPLYLFVSLLKVYQVGNWGTLWRFLCLSLLYAGLMVVAMTANILGTVWGSVP